MLTIYICTFRGNIHIISLFCCYFPAPISSVQKVTLIHKCCIPTYTYIDKTCNLFTKLSLCLTTSHSKKVYGSVEVQLLCILNFGTRWQWMVRFRSWSLYSQADSARLFMDRRLSECRWQSGRYRKKEKVCVCGESNPDSPSTVTVSTKCYVRHNLQQGTLQRCFAIGVLGNPQFIVLFSVLQCVECFVTFGLTCCIDLYCKSFAVTYLCLKTHFIAIMFEI